MPAAVVAHRRALGAPSSIFVDPSSVGGLSVWLDAPFLAQADNSAVSSFTDRSSNSRNATQATGANQPTYKTSIQNGLAVVRFDGTNDELSTTAFVRAQPQTTFTVFKLNATTGIQTVFDGVSVFNAGRVYLQVAVNANLQVYSGTAGFNTPVTPFSTAFGILVIIWSGASSKIYTNGGTAVTGNPGAPQANGLRLGAYGSGTPGGWGNLDIGEMVVYDGVKTLADINNVGSYLGTRWGITWTTAT